MLNHGLKLLGAVDLLPHDSSVCVMRLGDNLCLSSNSILTWE